uniref:30S ribosomal protein S17 n=1 Tax=Nephromyces sp. ex Molgula occidentalis TaxID=2544991 RepID=A0A5C1H7J5_9APIC|nr:30S ribosomal protein S17 [Nephromyces sp. ex Molgula occidentalis]
MTKNLIGFVIFKINKTIKILSPYLTVSKKYNIKRIKYKKYLIDDLRNEAIKGDWVYCLKINSKSKYKKFKIIKILKNYGTNKNNI